MKSVNGAEYFPNTNNGPIHQALTAAVPTSHPPRCFHAPRHNRSTKAGRHAIIVAVAFTAPISAMGTTAAATSRQVSRVAPMSGRTVHGIKATGQASEEIAVSVVSTRGLNAYSSPATHAGHRAKPSLRATKYAPENPTPMTTVHHSRCAIQSGSGSVSRKNSPCGKRYPYAWF